LLRLVGLGSFHGLFGVEASGGCLCLFLAWKIESVFLLALLWLRIAGTVAWGHLWWVWCCLCSVAFFFAGSLWFVFVLLIFNTYSTHRRLGRRHGDLVRALGAICSSV